MIDEYVMGNPSKGIPPRKALIFDVNDEFSGFVYNDVQRSIKAIAIKDILKLYENIFYKDKSNNYKIHHDCLIKFFKTQQTKIFFKCPYRYVIDFNSCKYLIDYKIIHNN
jgi:hypothetical protein